MSRRRARFHKMHIVSRGFAAGLLLTVVVCGLAYSQSASPSQPELSPSAPQPQQPAAPPASAPGLLDKLHEIVKETVDDMSAHLKGTKSVPGAGGEGTTSRLPSAGIVIGRAKCPMAENGSPDCRSAVDMLCKSKGYTTGTSLGTETAETCHPRVYVPGHQRKPEDCSLDTFVIRAACN